MIDQNYKYLDVFPEKIYLKKILEQSYHEGRVTLTNITDKFVIYKVYINQNSIYSVNPSTSFIPPRGTVTVFIKRLNKVISYYIYNNIKLSYRILV
jgi:hypothetical protein